MANLGALSLTDEEPTASSLHGPSHVAAPFADTGFDGVHIET